MKDLDYYLSLSYRTILHEEDGCFFATIEGIPGCMAEGADPTSAHQELRALFRDWIELAIDSGYSIPEPVSDFSGRIHFRTSRNQHRWLIEEADRQGLTMNGLLREIVSKAQGYSVGQQHMVWAMTLGQVAGQSAELKAFVPRREGGGRVWTNE